MPELATLIIADDLTGALDSVAPFASVGMDCVVATSPDSLSRAMAHAPDVVSINLGTRELGPEKAHDITRLAAQAAQRYIGPDTIWFKKIDSRMKGHVAD
jgi:D-threonate/D-erythronate kinase